MDRSLVAELHYIAPVANLPSMAKWGLVSHNLARSVEHASVAAEEIQDRRAGKRVPQGLLLHDYVNLYLHARNPMMSRLRNGGCAPIVVLRIDPSVLDLPNAIIADGNAAADYTRFYPSPQGIERLDEERVYARWWTDSDRIVYFEKKRKRCAEVLIPERIAVEFIRGAYVCDTHGAQACQMLGIGGEVNNDIFFK
ncbi:DUF4433 domain-containing protein [Micromonospora sp. STR1_7]|uniref:DUF4433 domain-containing protein n=1 Tax=Micromonospora parastrephiae TaxID=2806101 RepID=A0ABS1XU30_9ACTN|nr:DUF4433 domain-containing protein [Micromonospora parastrephiae]MBM0232659.1 DUF4433 domain-containing protein [Micromonospora parastrephiae]